MVERVQIRNACITWNNPPVEKLGPFGEDLPKEITYIVWSLECGKKGNIHWQMYVEFNRSMTLGGIKKLFGEKTIHIERRKGQLDAYHRSSCSSLLPPLQYPCAFQWRGSYCCIISI